MLYGQLLRGGEAGAGAAERGHWTGRAQVGAEAPMSSESGYIDPVGTVRWCMVHVVVEAGSCVHRAGVALDWQPLLLVAARVNVTSI